MIVKGPKESEALKKTLTPIMLWGLGVGYVISGMYFGWNLGLLEGGTLGMGIATFFIIIMYATFSFSYSELACAIPKAGGVFDYANRALGKDLGFIAGMAQNIEFIFAPPAIAFAIGAYFNLFFPEFPILVIAVTAYLLFTALNVYGIKAAATFELVITIFAVGELLVFAGITLPHFELENLTRNALPNGFSGALAAIPFAVWFFLGIEGVANVAEETVNPQRDITKGFGSAIITLIALCIITFIACIGVGGWETVVFNNTGEPSDSPLPLAMSAVVGDNNFLFHMLITIGLLGLVASFHGLILAAGRSSFEFGRYGLAPAFIGRVNKKFKTPANALIVNMGIGIAALLTGKTGEIITLSVFGALTLYILSMISLFKLRKNEPLLIRPYKVPFYPVFPFLALIIAVFSIVVMSFYNFNLALIYFAILFLSYIGFRIFAKLSPSI
ncbi:MAG: ethanolamine permease [Bacteroidota bacterium]|nr:ethanolamine permease [Bacteroidota bacterium]